MASIRCGNCKQIHGSVDEVRRCYGLSAGIERASSTPRRAAGRPTIPELGLEPRDRQEILESISRGLAGMPSQRHAMVLKAHLALGGGAAPTLETLGEQLGVSRERVRQLEDKALTRLRPAMAKSSAEASTLATLARLVDAGRDGWQGRVIGLAALLFPDAPERTSRRLVMYLATVKATKEQREAILSSPEPTPLPDQHFGHSE